MPGNNSEVDSALISGSFSGFFSSEVVNVFNSLSGFVVETESLEVFKSRLASVLDTLWTAGEYQTSMS